MATKTVPLLRVFSLTVPSRMLSVAILGNLVQHTTLFTPPETRARETGVFEALRFVLG